MRKVKTITFEQLVYSSDVKDYCRLQREFVLHDMLCMYNYVDKNYDAIIHYAHIMILPLEIIIIIHYTIHLTYCITHSTITYYTRVMHF